MGWDLVDWAWIIGPIVVFVVAFAISGEVWVAVAAVVVIGLAVSSWTDNRDDGPACGSHPYDTAEDC
jgi:hypothetical protein